MSLSTLIWRERCCGKSIGDSCQSCSLRITSTSLTRLFFPAHQCSGSRLILCVVCHLFCGAITNEKGHQHLVGQQYSWVSSVFYFGYLSWAYPTTYLIQRLPVGKYVSINTIIWGTLVALTAACKNFGGLVTVRFLLGVAEATITPAFIYITSMWYTRDEIPVKTGAWFAGNSFGGLVASLAAYGIGRIEEPLSPWQWLFIVSCHYPNLVFLVLTKCKIFGLATGLWGVVILFILPDSIESCGFLNEEEKKCAQDRVVLAGTGKASKETSQWKRDQVFECFLDPKTWFFFAISICTQVSLLCLLWVIC